MRSRAGGEPAFGTSDRRKGNEQLPLSGEGVLVELVQAPAEVIEAHRKLSA